MQSIFSEYDRAKLIFDAPIVKNLSLQDVREPEDVGIEPIKNLHIGRGAEGTEFRINLATQSNHVYYISFDKYYLKQGETIYVEQSDDEFLDALDSKSLKAFEKVWDL